jgi:uncharacterized SAM-binding protein YcdF (DUF218 family)
MAKPERESAGSAVGSTEKARLGKVMTVEEVTTLLFIRDPECRADLTLVFGHHEPELAAQRARHAASLFTRGLTPRLLFSGGTTGQYRESEARFMAGVAESLGVPPEVILVEPESRTTVENLHLSFELLRAEGHLEALSAVHLVSCPLHMRRVSLLARRVVPRTVRLILSPHGESCEAESWMSSPECRSRVLVEARLVLDLLGS